MPKQCIQKDRQIWPRQILSVSILEPAMTVEKVYSHMENYVNTLKIKDLKEDHFTYIKRGVTMKCFYTDSNLIPYESGWNPTNYLREVS